MRKLIIVLGLCIWILPAAIAQIEEVSLRYVALPAHNVADVQRNKLSDTIPFFDDFSQSQVLPDAEKWLDRDVIINNTLAQRPPSLGVATFDGLNENGQPYGGGNGGSDTLTSIPLVLGNINSLFLSFQLQPKGFGLKPLERDSFVVEVLNPQAQWVKIFGTVLKTTVLMPLDPSDDAPDFQWYNLEIPDTLWHDAFQFRFRNRSSNIGLQELWHLDYVSLSELAREETFRDLAISENPDYFITPYSAMPWDQFIGNEDRFTRKAYSVGLFNNAEEALQAGESNLAVIDLLNDAFIIDQFQLLILTVVDGMDVNQTRVDVGYQTVTQSLADDSVKLINYTYPREPFEIETNYFVPTGEVDQGNLTFNDEASTITVMDDYFAYDDGTAESSLKDQVSGSSTSRIAVEFNATKEDKLNGVMMNLPRIVENSEDMGFDLRIWIDSLDDTPEFEMTDLRPEFADVYFDTLNPFTTYALRDENNNPVELDIPPGRFFIGWQTTTPIRIGNEQFTLAVGFDKNNPEGTAAIWSQVNNLPWENLAASNSILQGSLMIRALFAEEPPISTTTEDLAIETLNIYPNPTTGIFQLQTEIETANVEVVGLNGMQLKRPLTSNRIDISDLPSGVYILRLISEDKIYQNMVIKQ